MTRPRWRCTGSRRFLILSMWTLAQAWGFMQRGTPTRLELQALHVSLGLVLIAFSQQQRGIIGQLHEWVGNAIVGLAALHALAALFHQFWLRDGVLLRMLPRGPLSGER